VGAIINDAQLAKIMQYIDAGQADGAKLRLGGAKITTAAGQFIEPTVFDHVKPEMSIAREEIFGPVLAIVRFEDASEALRIIPGGPSRRAP
jgi:4-guanidinobutyraldehyde dehydrogenase / NAD-dependent aldehyde dehydrogenase